MKRFFAEAAVIFPEGIFPEGIVPEGIVAEGRYGVALDGKPLRTPAKTALAVPSRRLAEAIAGEWRAQGAEISPAGLPLTRLASTAIDLVRPRRDQVVSGVARYAETELLCYRAEQPPELVRRQQQIWQPLLDWAALRYDAPLAVASGVLPFAQPAASLAALAAAVAAQDDLTLAALNLATSTTGSLIVALALIDGRLDGDAAFAAAELDESFEIERWGEDAEQAVRRASLREDITLAARFVALLR